MKAAYLILALLAFVATVAALILAYRSTSLLCTGGRSEGEVVRMETVPGAGSSADLAAPLIRYHTADGRTLEGRGPAEQYSQYGVGDRVTVYYDTNAPSQMRVAAFDGLWTGPIACLVLALLLGGTAGVLFASERNAPVPALVGGVFLMIGLPLLLGGIGQAAGRAQLLQTGSRARGVITNGAGKPWKLFKSSGEAMEVPAVIRFPAGEREVEFTTPDLNAYYARRDEPIDVVFEPRRPHGAAVIGFRFFWLSAVILGGVGALLTIGGLLLLRTGRVKRRSHPGRSVTAE
ncbi:MAG: hypothetical protein K0Q72_427 [Armatimonadetes bacterium]|nr:hypothetical protein [Armatimonadota bacterium]